MDSNHLTMPEHRDSSIRHGDWRFARSSKLLQSGRRQCKELISPGSFMGMRLVVLFSGDALPARVAMIDRASASSTNHVPEGDPDRRP